MKYPFTDANGVDLATVLLCLSVPRLREAGRNWVYDCMAGDINSNTGLNFITGILNLTFWIKQLC